MADFQQNRVQLLKHPPFDQGRRPLAFHRKLPGYQRTPLRNLPTLAARLGMGELLLKDESRRLELPAFKILGGSWALYREIVERELGGEEPEWSSWPEFKQLIHGVESRTLVTATDGNHGRGVARMARLLGWPCRVYMPRGTLPARIRAIEGEGAEVHVVPGNHDLAVQHARDDAEGWDTAWLIQDTAWPGYERIPNRIVEGYSTLLWEIEEQMSRSEQRKPDLVLVPVGVGSLAGAVLAHFHRLYGERRPAIVGVEPVGAACALASLRAGEMTTVESQTPETAMAGLNCVTLAANIWPLIQQGMDGVIAIEDLWADRALATLREAGVESAASGASSLAGLFALLEADELADARQQLRLNSRPTVLLFNTEGATDAQPNIS